MHDTNMLGTTTQTIYLKLETKEYDAKMKNGLNNRLLNILSEMFFFIFKPKK